MTTADHTRPPLSHATLQLFLAYAADACNWSGTPLIGGNIPSTRATPGHLTQMKLAGLVKTFKEDRLHWLEFTPAGQALAAEHGISLEHVALHPHQ